MSRARWSALSRADAVGTDRDASLTQTTGPCTGSTLTAVCAREVVAPPMRSGISKPWRCISAAKPTISSSEGVIRPDRPMRSASLLRCLDDLLGRHHDAEVDDLVVVALEDHADDVLADVVDVSLTVAMTMVPLVSFCFASQSSPSPPR